MTLPNKVQQQLTEQTANPWSAEFVERMERLVGKDACRRLAIFALPADFVLSVVVPVYNEALTVASVVDLASLSLCGCTAPGQATRGIV